MNYRQLSKEILFITSNDGSDMRINKEIRSLAEEGSSIYFLGVASDEDNCFVKEYCKEVVLIKGPRNSVRSIAGLVFASIKILFHREINNIHIINEQLMIFFYPILFFRHTVLDLFDSLFLKLNKPGDDWSLLKKIVYFPVDTILVTDERRLQLMPTFSRKYCKILPNYPYKRNSSSRELKKGPLCILFNGWMGLNRGTEIAEGLLQTGLPIKFIMAGWFSDEHTRKLPSIYPDQISFRGVVPQEIALQWAEKEADYILCVYAPINTNNINASPNKVYDAIQTGTPLIANAETAVSNLISKLNVGYVLDEYAVKDFTVLYHKLVEKRNSFHWDHSLREHFSWENCQNELLSAHGLAVHPR